MLIPGVQAAKPQKVTLMVDDVPVAQVLQALAEQEKLNLVVSPDVSGTVSLHLTDVPWKQALQTVVKSAGLITRRRATFSRCIPLPGQNDNIARQEAEQTRAQANLPAGKSQYYSAIRRRRRAGESGGEATECQREYDRR
ncbi:outer membrane porin HofQ [Escherichia coli]|uniref:Outer membrane porin HofQ n=1 Tax=Escherichia coli TaxID=562 RepID=A0A376LFC3_ECOLX|nr:outer membrane porin HofQ [Escherichia coli]